MASTRRNFAREAKKLVAYGKRVGKDFGDGISVIAEEIMTDAKASRRGRGVPRDTGALAASGRTERLRQTLGRPAVLLSFGDAAAPYALRQHEELDYHHTVGEARYLVRAVDRWKPDGSQAMRAIRKNAEAAARRIGGPARDARGRFVSRR